MGSQVIRKTRARLGILSIQGLRSVLLVIALSGCQQASSLRFSSQASPTSVGTPGRAKSLSLAVARGYDFSNGNSMIEGSVFGTPLQIGTTDRLAGAIASLTWNGMEFIDQLDHGRELQSASSFEDLGECYNP